jgi:predicted RNA binding protein YcfA (HicA-like mRNA interferase family)
MADQDGQSRLGRRLPDVYYTHVRSSEVIRLLMADGWSVHNIRGSHHQFKHPRKPGKITVPHPKSEPPIGTARNIFKQAGMKWRT